MTKVWATQVYTEGKNSPFTIIRHHTSDVFWTVFVITRFIAFNAFKISPYCAYSSTLLNCEIDEPTWMALILKTKLWKLTKPAIYYVLYLGHYPRRHPVVFPLKADSYANKLAASKEIKNGKVAAKGSKNCIIATSSVIEVQS